MFDNLLQKLDTFWRRIKPHPLLPVWQQWLQWIAIAIGGAATLGATFLLLSVIVFSFGLPSLSKTESLLQAESTLIMDREGNVLYSIHGKENRKLVPLEDISQYLIDATIAVEDDEFYDHFGFDLPCLAKAFLHETVGFGIRRGCSTITQQLAKNLFLSPEQTYSRKIQELILSIKMEIRYTKDEILELYLNEIPYGNNAYGAEIASERYFSKPSEELTLTEAAILASLPKAPTRYSPYGNNKYSHLTAEFTEEQVKNRTLNSVQDLNIEEYIRGLLGAQIPLPASKNLYIPGRVDIVLNSMVEQGMITDDDREGALKESWVLEFKTYRESIKAPHFVLYVKELLEEKYGKDLIEQGGLKVYTTLDPKMQKSAEESMLKYRERNLTQFKASNASLVSIQPQTGQILAMVGSMDYFDETIDGNVNIATRYRQPGSSFKPFVYAKAFLNGYAPGSVIYDVSTEFGPNQWPKNYDGKFLGPISIRYALGHSRNIPAIKSYFLAGKEEEIIPFVEKFGIDLDASIGYGWPLALGSGEVRLLDMVEGYSVFANTGVKKDISPILKIENIEGEILEQWEENPGEEILDPQAAYLINNILSDKSVYLGPRLDIKGQVTAAKTGTSNKKDEKDQNLPNNNWIIGYTTKLVTGVWVGNSDGSALHYAADGYTTAAPIWNEFMTSALADLPSEDFPKPDGIVQVAISKKTGLKPSEQTPDDDIRMETFAKFNVPTEVESNRYITAKIDKTTGLLATEFSPEWSVEEKTFFIHKEVVADYPYWQAGIDAWVASQPDLEKPPTETDAVHTAETLANSPSIVITSPTTYSAVEGGRIPISVEIEALNGAEKVEFYLGTTLQFIETEAPYSGKVRIPINATPGNKYEITAYIYDRLGYRSESTIQVQIENSNESESEEEKIDEDEESLPTIELPI